MSLGVHSLVLAKLWLNAQKAHYFTGLIFRKIVQRRIYGVALKILKQFFLQIFCSMCHSRTVKIDYQWHRGWRARGNYSFSPNFGLSKKSLKIFLSAIFCPEMRNLKLKIPIWRKFRSTIEILNTCVYTYNFLWKFAAVCRNFVKYLFVVKLQLPAPPTFYPDAAAVGHSLVAT